MALLQFSMRGAGFQLLWGYHVGGVLCSDPSNGRHYQEVAGLSDIL